MRLVDVRFVPIALAIRAKAPVLVEDRVFDKSELLPGPHPAPRI